PTPATPRRACSASSTSSTTPMPTRRGRSSKPSTRRQRKHRCPMETDYYGSAGAPLVVVLHDWFGRLPWLEKVAQELAREGLQVAVPDFFDGRTADDDAGARALVDSIDIAAGLATVDDIIEEARLYGTERVGELGFSTGGWLALV